jgi:integrase
MSARKRRIQKDGSSVEQWLVDFRFKHPDGSVERFRIDSPVNTRRGAEQYEREVRQRLQDGTFRSKENDTREVKTLAQFEEPFLTFSKNNNKPSAVHAKKYILRLHLLPFFGAMRLNEIGAKEIERYKQLKQQLPDAQSAKSINNHLAVLRKMLNLAVEYDELDWAPKVKALTLPEHDFQFLDFDEAERLLAAAEPKWRCILTVALKTGLRIGELLALKWEDVDLKVGRLVVRRTLWTNVEGTPKGGKRREVPLSHQTVAMLKAHRHLMGPYVFCNEDGKRFTHNALQRLVPQTCRRAGLAKWVSWHDLRHTFASHLVMKGRSLLEVQQLLGHSTIGMTMRYAHLSPDVKRAAVEALDAPAPPSAGLGQ